MMNLLSQPRFKPITFMRLPLHWKNLMSIILITMSAFLTSVSMGMNAIILPTTMETLGFSNTLIGIIMSSGIAVAILVFFFLARLLTIIGLFTCFLLSSFLRVSAILLLIYTAEASHWLILVMLKGIATYLFLVLLQIEINSVPLNKYRGLVNAVFGASTSLGLATGPVVIELLSRPLLLDHVVPPMLVVSAGIGLVSVVPMLLAIPLIPAHRPNRKMNVFQVISLSPAIMFAVALGAVSHFGVSYFIVIYGTHNGLSLEVAASLYTVFILGALLTEIPLGWLSDFFDRRYVIMVIVFLSMACAVYLPIAIYSKYQSWILLFIWGGVTGTLYSLCLAVLSERFTNELTTATAAYSIMDNAGGSIGILIMGMAIDLFGVDGFPYTIMLVSILYFSFALTRYRVV